MTRNRTGILAVALLAVGACQDLDVVNENNPDTERALAEPAEVENVLRSAFNIWFDRFDFSDLYAYFPLIADEMTQTWTQRDIQPSIEPRPALKNDPLAEEVWIPRGPWDGWNSVLANSNDGLRRIKEGLRIITLDPGATETTDNTDRAWAWGKFWQGTGMGYAALSMDRTVPGTEETVLPESYDELVAFERENLRTYDEVMPVAIASLEEAIARIDASEPFTTPATWVNNQPLTSAQLRELANSMIARLLVYNARTPEEREAVDWQKVIAHTADGLTFDFGPTLQSGIVTSTFLNRLQSTTRMRADNRLVGPADVSGAYQEWLAKPLAERDRFDIVTPDRRITGPTPSSRGAYFRYRAPTDNNGFNTTRGLYNFSNYQWYRKNGASSSGQHVVFSADENRLLRAEAMLRTGNLQEAANLINVSRTRTVRIGSTNYQGLPAVTADGVPQSATCVPRTETGACGSLMDALRYERQIELAGTDPMRAWFDYRGFGQLVTGTPLMMPIPARYLVSMGLPLYTFGGVGGDGAAQ